LIDTFSTRKSDRFSFSSGTTISQINRAVLRFSIDRGFRFPGKFSFASISASADRGAAKKKITAAVPIWNTRPFREKEEKSARPRGFGRVDRDDRFRGFARASIARF
jgi:hypothetical protein